MHFGFNIVVDGMCRHDPLAVQSKKPRIGTPANLCEHIEMFYKSDPEQGSNYTLPSTDYDDQTKSGG